MKTSLTFVLHFSLVISSSSSGCFDKSTYYAIDHDVEAIASGIDNEDDLVHFYGGIVRMVSHDFMDYDRNSDTPMGSDGCIDWDHESNLGLWGSIWCDNCDLTKLYRDKYGHISKADFWIAAGNAVIRNLSVDKSLDLIDTFLWGRKDADSCQGQGDRVPTGSGCREIEDVFLDAMGLKWRDAVALLGAHTIGKGHIEFSGHDGYWMPTTAESLVFDKQYYEELMRRPWRARNIGTKEEDFIASTEITHEEPQMMLKTDVCLLFDTDNFYPCCTRTNRYFEGQNWCDWEEKLSDLECIRYDTDDSRMEAVKTVIEFLGGPTPNENNGPFYKSFAAAWFKATTNGHENLKTVSSTCW